jgi:hypothetical protein
MSGLAQIRQKHGDTVADIVWDLRWRGHEINPMDVAVCDVNEVVDYYRLSSDKRLLFGGACNYSGHGVCASHVMGEVVADAVGGTMERFDLFAKLKPYRIPGSQWFGNQLIALGMLYYKMKDLM